MNLNINLFIFKFPVKCLETNARSIQFSSVLFNIFLNHKGKSDLCQFEKKSMNVNVPMENQENKTNNYSFV